MTKALTRAARNDFAGRSTGFKDAEYYDTKGHAVAAYDAALNGHSLRLDENDCDDFSGDEGRKTIAIFAGGEDSTDVAGYAHLVWYRMPSGRYEFTGYCTN